MCAACGLDCDAMGSTPDGLRSLLDALDRGATLLTWAPPRAVTLARSNDAKLGFHFKTYSVSNINFILK